MLGHRRLAAVGIAAALCLAGTGSANAATPQQIYRDLTDNGRLDRRYTRGDIERAFDLPPVVKTDKRVPTAREPIAVPPTTEAVEASSSTRRSGGRVPFSPLDVALLVAVGGPLLLLGIGLRRRIGPAPNRAPIASG